MGLSRAPATSFETVAQLSLWEQRRLLESGDAPERLWAAWAIALQRGHDALPLVRSVERGEIPNGLRRQLLVVLAGFGERELLRAIADADPSASVRATAIALYLRTADDGTVRQAVELAVRQLRTGPIEVRRAILVEHETGRATLPFSALLDGLTDAEVVIRVASAACLGRELSSEHQAAAVAALVGAFVREADADARKHYLALLPRASVHVLLRAVADQDPDRLERTVIELRATLGPLGWDDVEPIAYTAGVEVIRALLASEARAPAPHGLRWLCHAYRVALALDSRAAHDLHWRVLHLIPSSLTAESAVVLGPDDRAMLRAAFELDAVALRAAVDDEGDEWDPEHAEAAAAERQRILALLA